MTLIEYILNRKKENFVPFEETQRGKAIFEKMKEAAAERARKDEEWERTVSPGFFFTAITQGLPLFFLVRNSSCHWQALHFSL